MLSLCSVAIPVGCSAQDARLIARNIFPSVVMLEMQDSNGRPITLGSGFFVRSDIVATNFHVIEGSKYGFAKVVGETSTYRIEGTVGLDKSRDLALLKLAGAKGKPLVLADLSQIEVGQEIFALGNPRGLEGTISPGIISGLNLREVGNENLLQITAPISAGSSGGPVVNRNGEVIGVAVASLEKGQNLNFAVPSSYLAILLAGSRNLVLMSGTSNLPVEQNTPSLDRDFVEPSTNNWKEVSKTDTTILYYDPKSTRLTDSGSVLVWQQLRKRTDKSLSGVVLTEIDCSRRVARTRRLLTVLRNGERVETSFDEGWRVGAPKTVGGSLIAKACDLYY